MDVRLTDSEALSFLDPWMIQLYLGSRQWQRVDVEEGGSAWINPMHGDDSVAWVPKSSRMRGYPTRVSELLNTLSLLEGRSEGDVYFEIAHSLSDVQNVRSLPGGEPGTIALLDGVDTVNGLRRWLLTGATSTALPEPQIVHPNSKPAEARDFLNKARLATPIPGSFVWRVVTPVSESGQMALPYENANDQTELSGFNRAVTLQLFSATSAAVAAAREVIDGRDAIDPFIERVDQGVNANLCESLVDISADGAVPFEIAFSWATGFPVPENSREVKVDLEQVSVMREAAVDLRRRAPEANVTVYGYVIRLFRDSDVRPGQITIGGAVEGDVHEQVGNYWLELADTEYRAAVHAHEEGLPVRATGDLVRAANRRTLQLVRDFTVMPQEN